MSETWKEIAGFPGYEVSDLGGVRSWRRNGAAKTLRTEPVPLAREVDKDGYIKVRLFNCGRGSKFFVHRLVLEAFVGPCPEGHEARHMSDRDPANCMLSNLAWGTKVQNMGDKRRHGTMPQGEKHWTRRNAALANRGEKCPQSRLTESDVMMIHASSESDTAIAKRLGVSVSAVNKVRRGKNWKHLFTMNNGANDGKSRRLG